MTTQPEAAVGNEAPAVEAEAQDPRSTFDNLAEEMFGPDEPEEDELQEQEAEQGEDPENAEEVAEQEVEPELPAIEPPVSWDKEAKDVFSKLPREAQEIVAKREADRERFVQTKSQEAAQAQRNATIEAMKLAEQHKAQAAQVLEQYAKQFEVTPPNPDLYLTNPAQYAQELHRYQTFTAQREQAQRDMSRFQQEQAQIQQARQQHEAQAFHQQLQAEVPEVFDPSTGHDVLKELTATAELLGFDPNQISDVTAIKALKVTSEWKTKAEKYDALMKKQMERVRSGKSPPPIAKPGTARLPEQTRKARGEAAWNNALNARTRVQRDQAVADWAEATGFFD